MNPQDPLNFKLTHYRFLAAHPFCQVVGCAPLPSTDVHHMAGRWGKKLLETDKFLAVCRPCHQRIEENKKWARVWRYIQY